LIDESGVRSSCETLARDIGLIVGKNDDTARLALADGIYRHAVRAPLRRVGERDLGDRSFAAQCFVDPPFEFDVGNRGDHVRSDRALRIEIEDGPRRAVGETHVGGAVHENDAQGQRADQTSEVLVSMLLRHGNVGFTRERLPRNARARDKPPDEASGYERYHQTE